MNKQPPNVRKRRANVMERNTRQITDEFGLVIPSGIWKDYMLPVNVPANQFNMGKYTGSAPNENEQKASRYGVLPFAAPKFSGPTFMYDEKKDEMEAKEKMRLAQEKYQEERAEKMANGAHMANGTNGAPPLRKKLAFLGGKKSKTRRSRRSRRSSRRSTVKY